MVAGFIASRAVIRQYMPTESCNREELLTLWQQGKKRWKGKVQSTAPKDMSPVTYLLKFLEPSTQQPCQLGTKSSAGAWGRFISSSSSPKIGSEARTSHTRLCHEANSCFEEQSC